MGSWCGEEGEKALRRRDARTCMYMRILHGGNGLLLSRSWNYDLGNLSLRQMGLGVVVQGGEEPFIPKYSSASCIPEMHILATHFAMTLSGSLIKFNFCKSLLGKKERVLLALDSEFPLKTLLSK